MLQWVVVADDFTGAAELGAAARRLGLTISLSRGIDGTAPKDVAVWVIDTDTREQAPSDARRRLAELGRRLRTEVPEASVFKKVDSVLRGFCACESEALAQALGRTRLLVAPGNPRRGREVRAGRLLVDGIPLEQTVFGDDPTFPATRSEVKTIWESRGAEGAVETQIADEVRVDGLAGLAAQATGPDALPVGALEFFEACIQTSVASSAALPSPVLPRHGGALLVCGSRAGWAERVDWFTALSGSITTRGLPSERSGVRLLGIGLEPAGEAAWCAKDLAKRAAAHILATRPALIGLEGGATAAAVLSELGWEAFELFGEVEAGTAALRPMGESAVVLVKPGSYLWPDAAREAFEANADR